MEAFEILWWKKNIQEFLNNWKPAILECQSIDDLHEVYLQTHKFLEAVEKVYYQPNGRLCTPLRFLYAKVQRKTVQIEELIFLAYNNQPSEIPTVEELIYVLTHGQEL